MGSFRKTSSAAPAHLAGFDGVFQIAFIEQLAARAVHDTHALLHLREGFFVQKLVGLGRERDVDRDVVAVLVEIRQADQLDPEILRDLRGDIRIVRKNAHLERARALHHFTADTAQADDAHRLAAQLAAEKLLLFPFAGFGGGARLRNEPRHRKHERDGVLGDRYRVAARRIHDEHARGRRGGEIDVIDTDARAPDDPQFRSLLQNFRRHLHGAANDQRLGAGKMFRDILSDWKR